MGGFIVEFSLAVTGRGEQEGELVAGTTLITLVPRVTQVGRSQPLCRDVDVAEKYEVLKFTEKKRGGT